MQMPDIYLKDSLSNIIDNLTKTNNIPAYTTLGLGFSCGFIYRYAYLFDIGIVIDNIYTPTFAKQHNNIQQAFSLNFDGATISRLEPKIRLGSIFYVPTQMFYGVVSTWIIASDISNIYPYLISGSINRNPLINICFGTEITFIDLIALRIGIYQSYLTTGIGLILNNFHIDFAIFCKELGFEPGSRPELNIALSVSIQ